MSGTIKSLKLQTIAKLPEHKLAALFETALQHCSRSTCPVLHIVSARQGEGSGRIALETAMIAAKTTGKNILFIDGSVSPSEPLNNLILNSGEQETEGYNPTVYETDIDRLSVCKLYDVAGNILPAAHVKEFLNAARPSHDAVILHSEGMLENESMFSFSQFTDATLLVIEAERTRSPVALQLKNMLEQSGANITGCVLNRRRFHIPGFVHKLLFRS